MGALLDWLYGLSLPQATLWLTAANVVMFAASLAAGHWLVRRYADRAVTPPPAPLERAEVWLAIGCVVLNSGVAVAGWLEGAGV